jgi:myo-inositol 2-dehydrogenase/D-chiro-inositol 1-dehydrogenase
MESYLAADLSAERNEPIDLPLTNETLSAITEMTQEKKRAAVG